MKVRYCLLFNTSNHSITEKEFCHWNKCPGANDICVSLSDGYECLTNATFDGVSTSVSYKHENFPNSSYSSAVENTIKAIFRAKYITSGTILHILGDEEYENKYIKISIKNGQLSLDIPEKDTMLNWKNWPLQNNVLSGDWQTVEIAFAAGGSSNIKAKLNNGTFELITVDSTIDFARFITTSKGIIIGASSENKEQTYNDQKDIYTSDGIDSSFESVQIHTKVNETRNFFDFFRGCIGEVRIAGVLLPFYEPSWLNETNFPNKKKFIATDIQNLNDKGCKLCYETECVHSGYCDDPSEKFECKCLAGFEDPICGTNIDECSIGNMCKNGLCQDGIANYTCDCQEGWEGWL